MEVRGRGEVVEVRDGGEVVEVLHMHVMGICSVQT